MAKSVYHVTPHDDRWTVKKEGNERASSTHDTQAEAIESARELARQHDDIVIHRPDGTIRERITYSGNGNGNGGSHSSPSREKVGVEDVVSVGTRVSWSAILAGAVVALTVYIALSFLALALTVTTQDEMSAKTLTIGAGIVMVFITLVSLFVGGFVVARTTVGENKLESIIYGLLLWGVLLVFFLVMGGAMGLGLGSVVAQSSSQPEATISQTMSADDLARQAKLELTAEQKEALNKALTAGSQAKEALQNVSPTTLSWVMFLWIVLSIFAAVGGSITGAGPELVLKQLRDRRMVLRPKAA